MKNYKFLLFNIFKKRKLCKFAILMFGIMICVYISVLGLKNGIGTEYKKIKNENIDHNYFLLSSEKKYKKMSEEIGDLAIVEKYYPLMHLSVDGYDLIYEDNTLITISDGENIKNKNDIVIPFDNEKNIGDKMQLDIDGINYVFNVIGKYSSNNYKYSIKKEIINPIFVSKEFIEDHINLEDIDEIVVCIIDYDYIEQFLSNIKEYGGYEVSIYDANTELLKRYQNFNNMIVVLSNVMVFFSFMFVIVISSFIIHDNKTDIAIMKSIGFSNLKILSVVVFYSILLLCISLIPSTIITLLLSLLFDKLIILNGNVYVQCFSSFFIVTLLSLIILYFIVRRINIIKLLNK